MKKRKSIHKILAFLLSVTMLPVVFPLKNAHAATTTLMTIDFEDYEVGVICEATENTKAKVGNIVYELFAGDKLEIVQEDNGNKYLKFTRGDLTNTSNSFFAYQFYEDDNKTLTGGKISISYEYKPEGHALYFSRFGTLASTANGFGLNWASNKPVIQQIISYSIDSEEKCYLSNELVNYMSKSGINSFLGAYVQAYIGTDEKIVFIKKASDFVYGYLMNAIGDSFNGTGAMRIYSDSGNVKDFDFAPKVIVYNSANLNGKKMEAYDAYTECFSNGVIKNEAIAYSLNSEGLVNRIAFAIDRTTYNPATITYPLTLDLNYTPTGESDSKARVYRGILASKYVINGNVPVFIVPSPQTSDAGDEKLYQKRTGNWSEKYFQPSEIIKAYNMDKFYQPQFYVINGEVTTNISQGDGKVHFYVIDKVSTIYNKEEDTIEKAISYYDNTTYKTVSIDKDASVSKAGYFTDVTSIDQLKKGDVIQLHTNSLGKIDIITVYFRISERANKAYGMYYVDSEVNANSVTYVTDATAAMPNMGVIYGKAKISEGNRVVIETVSDVESPVSVAGSVYGNAYFTIYDTQREVSTLATFSDILPDDIVLMRKYYNHVQDVIIIR